MSTSGATRATGNDNLLTLQYDLTSDEIFQIASARVKASRGRWLSRLAGIVALCMAIQTAMIGEWKFAAVFGMMGFTALTGYRASDRILKLLFRGVVHVELMLDQHGIRGTLDPRMRFRKRSESSQFKYAWSRLRKLEHVPNYLILEFDGGRLLIPNGGVVIPVTAFADAGDLQQCEAWAESGLAQQRQRPVA